MTDLLQFTPPFRVQDDCIVDSSPEEKFVTTKYHGALIAAAINHYAEAQKPKFCDCPEPVISKQGLIIGKKDADMVLYFWRMGYGAATTKGEGGVNE